MMTTTKNLSNMGVYCPLIASKTFRNKKTEYSVIKDRLQEYICRIFNHYVYLKSVDQLEFEALLAALSVEHHFLHMLTDLKKLHYLRMEQIIFEDNASFLEMLTRVDDKIQTVIEFVISAEQLLASRILDTDSLLFSQRQHLADEFNQQALWAFEQVRNKGTRDLIKELVKKHEFDHSFLMSGEMGDSFSDHSIAVVNALLILSLPSSVIQPDKDFSAIFDNTLNAFQQTKLWKRKLQEWKMVIENKCVSYTLHGCGNRMDFLMDIIDIINSEEEIMLNQFGIMQMNTYNQSGKEMMGRQIYENLNSQESSDDGIVRMTEYDLQVYLSYESEKQYINSLIKDECLSLDTEEEIVTDKAELPKKKAFERQKSKTEKQFLKNESDRTKLQLIMQEANINCLDGEHRHMELTMAWLDYHVLICLFYYLLDSKNGDSGLYSGLGSAFYRSFDKKEFPTLRTYEQFHRTQLALEKFGFSRIIRFRSTDDFDDKKIGHATLEMWFRMYKKLLPIFEKHLPRKA